MKDRIRKIRLDNEMQQSSFAQRIGVTAQYLSLLENGARKPSTVVQNAICREFGINPVWLETGEGDMKPPRKVSLEQEINDIMRGEDPVVAKMLAALAAMPPEWWHAFHDKLMEYTEKTDK